MELFGTHIVWIDQISLGMVVITYMHQFLITNKFIA